MQLSTKNDFLSEGTILVTDHQTAGRGQRGNTWEAKAGENLTFSLLLKPTFLAIKDIFSLNIFVALAVRKALEEFFFEQENFYENKKNSFFVKWANDIFYNNQKIGGILIENTIKGNFIQNSIVGIGLNINQTQFKNENATSLAKIINENTSKNIGTKPDIKFNLEYILHNILKHLEYYYLCAKKGEFPKQKEEYFAYLHLFDTWANYELPNGEIFLGKIIGITQEGYLEIQTENTEILTFGLKEIRFLC
jgi:BirA family biotin operon repressor/biotin-[acetyl-CoA-carboxylase] ligase